MRIERTFVVLVLAALAGVAAGCGNKGPLRLPPGAKGGTPDLSASTPLAPSVPILQLTPAPAEPEAQAPEAPARGSSAPLPEAPAASPGGIPATGGSTPGGAGTGSGDPPAR